MIPQMRDRITNAREMLENMLVSLGIPLAFG
jgi:hypothetical protein